MNVIRKKNEPSFFIARTRFCFYCANSRKKKSFFLLHELVNGHTAGNQKKKILFTARTHVFLLRELDQKKKKISFYCTNLCLVS